MANTSSYGDIMEEHPPQASPLDWWAEFGAGLLINY
jgi:hypothetical protein